jgi:hypothetical protein
MNSRRELLKLFGAGTIIAPIVGGVSLSDAQAKLIEPPKVELVGAGGIPPTIDLADVKSVSVVFEMQDGASARLTFGYPYGSGRLVPSDRLSALLSFGRVHMNTSPMHTEPLGSLSDTYGAFLR